MSVPFSHNHLPHHHVHLFKKNKKINRSIGNQRLLLNVAEFTKLTQICQEVIKAISCIVPRLFPVHRLSQIVKKQQRAESKE
jgi:hypothetical protein